MFPEIYNPTTNFQNMHFLQFADINDDSVDDLLIGSPFRNDDPSNLFSIGKIRVSQGTIPYDCDLSRRLVTWKTSTFDMQHISF